MLSLTMLSRLLFYCWLILSIAGAGYATYQWASPDLWRKLMGGYPADNPNIKTHYHFSSRLSPYSHKQQQYLIGQKTLINNQTKTLRYIYEDVLVACLQSKNGEALAAVTRDDGSFSTVNWSIPVLNLVEYRLDLPPKEIIKIPLYLDISRGADQLMKTARYTRQIVRVTLYTSTDHPTSWVNCDSVKNTAPLAIVSFPVVNP